MTVKEFVKIDKSFNNAVFIAKANYMIQRIYNAVTFDCFDEVNSFIGDKAYEKLVHRFLKIKKKDGKLVYDQIDVNTEIRDIEIVDDEYVIYAIAECSFFKYYLSDEGIIVSGDNHNKINVIHLVTFKKKIDLLDNVVNRCFGCGRSYNINDSSTCPYCGRASDLEDFDYYIFSFD